MTQPGQATPPTSDPPPKWLMLVAICLILLVAGWMMLHVNTSTASRECGVQYRSARTAADTARVDSLVPGGGREGHPEAHSCGFIRHTARWS